MSFTPIIPIEQESYEPGRAIVLHVMLGLNLAAQATDFGSYIPGTTGLKGGSVPPPGIYPVSFEFAYHSTDFRDKNGQQITQVHGEKFSRKAEALGRLLVGPIRAHSPNNLIDYRDLFQINISLLAH